MSIRHRRSTAPNFRTSSPYNIMTGKYAPLGEDEEYRRFELKDDMDGEHIPTGKNAYVLRVLDGDYTIGPHEIGVPDKFEEFKLYNFTDFSGTGRVVEDEGLPDETITDGTRGWCVKVEGSTRWEVLGGGGGTIKFAYLNADLNQNDSCEASIWSGDPLVYSGNN
ncbi:MAG: hypothetical protein U9Q07_09845, partial [Planctomycetota bacterium]|nr:hypothetical protein [Planctomycetota bacterium]